MTYGSESECTTHYTTAPHNYVSHNRRVILSRVGRRLPRLRTKVLRIYRSTFICFQVDRRLNRYLKEMANVRKRERRMTLMTATTKVVKKDSLVMVEAGSAICTPLPSPCASPSCLGKCWLQSHDLNARFPDGSLIVWLKMYFGWRHWNISFDSAIHKQLYLSL